MRKYVLALDQGTTSSRCVVFDRERRVAGLAQKEFRQIFPQPGWVEHDPEEIWQTQQEVMLEAMDRADAGPEDIATIGIANQRETTVVWDRRTGEPIANAIVWQCRRTAERCAALKADQAFAAMVRERTGLVVDAYFSASKIQWLLDSVPGARARAEAGELRFGTVDAWLVWKLTQGAVHATDHTNASRTMLYDTGRLCWDADLCRTFGVPLSMLPEVRPSAGFFGACRLLGREIPVLGVAGDQQASLFGQGCTGAGQAKNTYGTGCFLLMHTGSVRRTSAHGLLSTMAATLGDGPAYALEGSVFIGGAVVQWLRDGLGIIAKASETEGLARSVPDAAGVYLVPAFAGLGAPWWDMDARGGLFGLTRGATRAHVARAALEAIAYQCTDLVHAMEQDAGMRLESLSVDGGACTNGFLMQFQADVAGLALRRASVLETTALGAASLAGLACGVWNLADLKKASAQGTAFLPAMPLAQREGLLAGWHEAVDRVRSHS